MLFLKRIFIIFVALLLIISVGLFFEWKSFLKTPLIPKNKQAISFVFVPGSSSRTLAIQLTQMKLIKHPAYFILLSRYKGLSKILKAGEYRVDPGMTIESLLDKMAKGDVIYHQFKIIEGWTFKQILSALESNTWIVHTITGLSNDEIMKKIGHEGELPEGRFAPDTYFFSGCVKDIDLLISAYQLMQKRFAKEWELRDKSVSYHCAYEALISASIIEKETYNPKDEAMIAGVILHRLAKDMLLQIDPTVIYGLGSSFTGKLSKDDLLKFTPYNTYVRKGLPPSPICMPSLTSIHAALHPIMSNALYYVSKGDGTHEFSATITEHEAKIKQLKIKN